MLFTNRVDAGKKLALLLTSFKGQPNTLVVALPRGGVEVGFEVAKALKLPLDITCPRKIGVPDNPELAIGAITETGEGIFSNELIADLSVPSSYLQMAKEQAKEEAKKRLALYRAGKAPRNLKDKVVLLVDDGLATGSTMLAALQTVKREKALQVVMAVPVAPQTTLASFKDKVDSIVCLHRSSSFFAVGQFYEHFEQTTDAEVIALLQQAYQR